MPLQDLFVGGSSWREETFQTPVPETPSPLQSNTGQFYPDRILRDAAAQGTITTTNVDGSADWLRQLPQIGSAVIDLIGARRDVSPAPATPASWYGGGDQNNQTVILGILAVAGLGVYLAFK